MDYFPRNFVDGLAERLTGPGKARLLVQPLVAIALGVRDGMADAKQGLPPYFDRVLFTSKHKLYEIKTALRHIAAALTVGFVMDLVFQWLVFRVLNFLPALLVGSIFVALPYVIARGLTDRFARRWYYDPKARRESERHTVVTRQVK